MGEKRERERGVEEEEEEGGGGREKSYPSTEFLPVSKTSETLGTLAS